MPSSHVDIGRRPSVPTEDLRIPRSDWKGMYLYRILGLNKDATAEQIERKYHDLEIKYRMDPNLGSDFEKTRMLHDINCAYKVLSNRRRRQIYDRLGGDVLSIFQAQRDDRDGAAIERWLHCIIKPCPMWSCLTFGLFTCGFCCCCCCCLGCCNGCCGKYPFDVDESLIIEAQPLPQEESESST